METTIKNAIESTEKKIMAQLNQNKKEMAEIKEDLPKKANYNDKVMKNLDINVRETNKLVKSQMKKREESSEEKLKRIKKTRIVRKPLDVNLRSSKDLRVNFPVEYKHINIEYCRISVGGSFIFEFESEEAAKEVHASWKKEYYGGNSGMVLYNEQNTTGIVKYVYDRDLDEDTINEEIQANYPNVKHELFRNKEGDFTGMIKVVFPDIESLNKAIENKLHISHRKYIVEPFQFKPKIIKCNTCQMFGHISRRCRNQHKLTCGQCCEKHETKDCTADESEYKCFHCKQTDHVAGSYSCPKVKEKLKELSDRNYLS